jgi:hypothetical protein
VQNKTLLDNRWGGLVYGALRSLGVFSTIDAPPRPICARALTLIWLKICQVDIVVLSYHFSDGLEFGDNRVETRSEAE